MTIAANMTCKRCECGSPRHAAQTIKQLMQCIGFAPIAKALHFMSPIDHRHLFLDADLTDFQCFRGWRRWRIVVPHAAAAAAAVAAARATVWSGVRQTGANNVW